MLTRPPFRTYEMSYRSHGARTRVGRGTLGSIRLQQVPVVKATRFDAPTGSLSKCHPNDNCRVSAPKLVRVKIAVSPRQIQQLIAGPACESQGMRAKGRDYMIDAIQTFSCSTASDRNATGKPLAYSAALSSSRRGE
jgi:hypothetical protein